MLLKSSDIQKLFTDALNYTDGSVDKAEPAFVPFTGTLPGVFQGIKTSEYISTIEQGLVHVLGSLNAVGVYDLVSVHAVGSTGNTYVVPAGYPGAGSHSMTVATSPYRRGYGTAVYWEFLVPPGTVFNLTAGNPRYVGQVRRCALFSFSSNRFFPVPVDVLYYGYCQPPPGVFQADNNSSDAAETVFTCFFNDPNLLLSRLFGISPRAFTTTSNYAGHRVVSSVPHFFHSLLIVHPGGAIAPNSVPVSVMFTGYKACLFSSRPGDSLVTFINT
jgi:hypothetical protein